MVFLLFIIVGIGANMLMQSRNQAGQVLGAEEELETTLPEYYTQAVVITRAANALSITPITGEGVHYEKKGDQYIYEDAYVNTDVIYTKYIAKIKEDLVFDKPGHPREFSYRLGNLDHYTVERDKEGNLVFFDKEKLDKYNSKSLSRVFVLPRPFLQDSLGNISYQAVTMMLEEDILTITLNPLWLQESFYPITLDPGWE